MTGVTIYKGKSGEIVKRHVNSLIMLMRPVTDVLATDHPVVDNNSDLVVDNADVVAARPTRAAAAVCADRNRDLARADLV